MSKELFVSSTPHETKVAVVEEDQVAEVYFERENEYTLAGSIYKGRVTRVLPGMQSAFVDIGLERDAFLYVTDFFEQPEGEEEGEIEAVSAPQSNGGRHRHEHRQAESAPAVAEASEPANREVEASVEEESPIAHEPGNRQSATEPRDDQRRFGRRRRGRRGRGFPDSKFDRGQQRPEAAPRREERSSQPPTGYQPIILPGESISKYRNIATSVAPAQVEERPEPATQAHEVPHYEQEEEQQRASSFSAPEESNGEPAAAPRRPTEEIDVPSILASHQAQEEQSSSPESSSAFVADENENRHAPAFGSAGVVEEEEIDEEESEAPGIGSSYEEDEYEDFEEEMLDRVDEIEQSSVPQSNVGEAEPYSEGEHTATEPQLEEAQPAELSASEHAEEEIEEQDLEEEMSEEPAEAETDATRAEVRGPSGYQQRVAFDRNRQRGRRGGRRAPMRGRRFHRAPLPQISELLKEGQEILVQIAKEPIGRKGARITSHIALPGRFLVYMPTVNHNGVSRKIASDEERQRLKRIILSERQSAGDGHPGGFIVRTAAAAASDDDLRADIRFLLNLWSEIQSRSESSKSPALIYHDLNLVERTLRDQVSEGFSHIWVDSEQEYERILRFVNRFQSSLTKRVKLYTKETPLFEQFGIQDEINKALKSKVWLKSGGYIVINQTEALVAIDVNTGKYVGKTQKLEDTIVKTNVDAIREIVRQIRLRDLGGIIVIDFIDMDERRNRQKVMQALEEALKNDRAPSKVLQFNDFGLVAITRKRVKQSLERTLGSPCTYCTGTGLIKSVSTVCNELYVEMRKMMNHLERGDVIVRVNPEVGKALKANNARWLQDMEELTGKTVIVKSDATLHQEQFDIH